jgi:hypothetical protein
VVARLPRYLARFGGTPVKNLDHKLLIIHEASGTSALRLPDEHGYNARYK